MLSFYACINDKNPLRAKETEISTEKITKWKICAHKWMHVQGFN